MIPAIGLMIAAYTIARLAQVFVEHSDADCDRRRSRPCLRGSSLRSFMARHKADIA